MAQPGPTCLLPLQRRPKLFWRARHRLCSECSPWAMLFCLSNQHSQLSVDILETKPRTLVRTKWALCLWAIKNVQNWSWAVAWTLGICLPVRSLCADVALSETVVLENSDIGALCMNFAYSCWKCHVMWIQHSAGSEDGEHRTSRRIPLSHGDSRRASLRGVGFEQGSGTEQMEPITHFCSANEWRVALQTRDGDRRVSTTERADLIRKKPPEVAFYRKCFENSLKSVSLLFIIFLW